jgi:hypothetical protein
MVTVGAPTISIEVREAVATVTAVVPLTELNVAVTVTGELFTIIAVSNPPDAVEATAVFDEDQVTCAVKSLVDWSLYVPVAVNCCRVPTGIVGVAGVTAMEVSVTGGGVELPPLPLLHPANSPAETSASTNRALLMGETPQNTFDF